MSRNQPKESSLSGKRILLVLSGSIAAYKAGDLIKILREEDAEVTCVMTGGARKFITPLTLRAISGKPVYSDAFDVETPYDVLHTALADESDVIIVAPASANFIARLSAGMADDLASCSVLAARGPVMIVPAMNDRMYAHSLTQRNLRILQETGYHIVAPVEGDLVCGRTAIGHIAEPSEILTRLKETLAG